jgi:hypothetical protein
MWQTLLAPVAEVIKTIGGSWLETKKVKAEGKIKIAQTKIDSEIKMMEAKANMDLSAQEGMQYSWKDEYLTIILSIPVMMCFIPEFTVLDVTINFNDIALNGFAVLDKTPEWYRWALTGMIAAVFGLRTWAGWRKP